MEIENMDITEGITKRLSFCEVSQQLVANQKMDVEDVIKALKNPSVENFETALGLLQQGCNKRFDIIEETAREQSAGVGEADLRRMKRQFSSLKNTFLHYVVKDEFIASLADGLPNGTEDIQLASYEEQGQKTIERLRQLKAANEQTQQGIGETISHITATIEEIKHTNDAAATMIATLRQEVEAAAAEEIAMPPLPGPGPDEVECHAALADEESKAHALEAQIAAQMAEIADLQAILPAEREQVQIARAELSDLEEQRSACNGDASTQGASTRFASTSEWADQAVSLLQALGGIRIEHLESSSGTITLHLSTSYPTAAVSGGSIGPCANGSHTLKLTVNPTSGVVESASLTPDDIDTMDILDAAMAGSRGVEFVIREIRTRLAGVLHRRALAREVQSLFPGTTMDASGMMIKAPVRPTNAPPVHVQIAVEQSWPSGDDTVRVVAVNGVIADAEKAVAVKSLRATGTSIAAVLRQVQTMLTPSPAMS